MKDRAVEVSSQQGDTWSQGTSHYSTPEQISEGNRLDDKSGISRAFQKDVMQDLPVRRYLATADSTFITDQDSIQDQKGNKKS